MTSTNNEEVRESFSEKYDRERREDMEFRQQGLQTQAAWENDRNRALRHTARWHFFDLPQWQQNFMLREEALQFATKLYEGYGENLETVLDVANKFIDYIKVGIPSAGI